MTGTRYVLLAGGAALGLAVSLPALSCGDKAAKTDAALQPAAMTASSGGCATKTEAVKVQPVAMTASADACCAGKTDAVKAQPAALKTASAGGCEAAPAAVPASFAVRSQAAMTQAAKAGSLVMVAVNTTFADAKACPTSAKTASLKTADAKACPTSAETSNLKAASVKTASAEGCPLTAAKAVSAAGKGECETVKATQAKFVNLQVNPNDCPGSKAFAAKYNVKTYPTTLFLDAKGKEVHRVSGEVKPEVLTAAMDTALANAGEKVASRG